MTTKERPQPQHKPRQRNFLDVRLAGHNAAVSVSSEHFRKDNSRTCFSLTSPKVVRILSGPVRTTASEVWERRVGRSWWDHVPTRDVCPTTSWDTVARPIYSHASLPGRLTCTLTGNCRYISLVSSIDARDRAEGLGEPIIRWKLRTHVAENGWLDCGYWLNCLLCFLYGIVGLWYSSQSPPPLPQIL